MSTKSDKPRLGKGLSSLMGKPVAVRVSDPGAEDRASASIQITPANTAAVAVAPPGKAETREKATADESRGEGAAGVGGLVEVGVRALVPGKFQPRREMDGGSLERLAASIRASGVMQPIAVRRLDEGDDRRAGVGGVEFEIVAGERRWRAAQMAGLEHVPAVVSDLSDREAAEWALVENLQREDLNTMDRAWGLRNLVESFGLAHAEVGVRVGLDRSSVSNLLRLTELETSVQSLLREGSLGLGHGKALLSAGAGAEREKLAKLAASQKWSVRRLERAAGALGAAASAGEIGAPKLGGTAGRDPLRADAAIRELERQLGEHFGTRVRITTGASRTKGRVVVDFYSLEHFDGLMGLMGVEIRS